MSPRALLNFILVSAIAAGVALAQEKPPRASTPTVQVPENYHIQANDLLDVRVYQEDDASAQVRVTQEGRVTLPYVKEMKLAGLTLGQAARAIEAALRNGYLVSPTVNVQVVTFGTQKRFTVRGAVAKQSVFEIPPDKPISLVEAVAMAGPTNVANQKNVVVKSRIGSREVYFKFNVKAMAESVDKTKQYFVRDGDIITVKENPF